jgi:hypothetical protein
MAGAESRGEPVSAILPHRLQELLLMDGSESLVLLLGVLAILLLVTLLVEREALRAAAGGQPTEKGKLLDVAIFPLIFIFTFVVLEHFYRLIF